MNVTYEENLHRWKKALRNGPLTTNALAAALGIDPFYVHTSARTLLAKGVVTKTRQPRVGTRGAKPLIWSLK